MFNDGGLSCKYTQIISKNPLDKPLDLSKITRYFEIGAKTLLGADMIEKGVPIITVRKLEKIPFQGDSLNEQFKCFLHYRYYIQRQLKLDTYEQMLLDRYCSHQ